MIFITYVSLWNDKNEQSFDSMEELIENAIISDFVLLSVLPEISMDKSKANPEAIDRLLKVDNGADKVIE